MPILPKAKHEIVAKALAAGQSQADAYRAAGYVYKPANASRLCRSSAIEARVQELIADRAASTAKAREIGIQRAGLSEEWIIVRLKHVIDLSIRGLPVYDSNGQPNGFYKPNLSAAINGLKTAALIGGLLVQKHEIGGSGAFARMTDEELDNALIEQCRAIGLSERSVNEIKTSIKGLSDA
jgi:hypothetical protein